MNSEWKKNSVKKLKNSNNNFIINNKKNELNSISAADQLQCIRLNSRNFTNDILDDTVHKWRTG